MQLVHPLLAETLVSLERSVGLVLEELRDLSLRLADAAKLGRGTWQRTAGRQKEDIEIEVSANMVEALRKQESAEVGKAPYYLEQNL